jgi:hypothetical protein
MVYRQRTRAQTQFGDYLDLILVERKHSVRSFARLVKVTSASITTFKRTRPPKKRIFAWADALRLTGPARQRFIELAWLTHTPAFISERYMELQSEVERLTTKPTRSRGKSTRT